MVVNHHLLCADLAVKDGSYGQVIPAYDTLVLDEAHLIEDVATQYFGVQVSSHRVEDLARDVERGAQGGEARRARRAGRGGGRAPARRPPVRPRSPARPRRPARPGLDDDAASPRSRSASCSGWRACARRSSPCPTGEEAVTGLAGRGSRPRRRARVPDAGRDRRPRLLRRDARPRRLPAGACRSTCPGGSRSCCFDEVRAAVLTSATLAVDGGFAYVKDRLGLEPTDELLLASPFRYEEQAVLYVPGRHAGPRSPEFVDGAAERDRAPARAVARPRLRALHLVRQHERGGRADRRSSRLSAPHPGRGAEGAAARGLPRDAPRGAPRHRVLLAGRRRRPASSCRA